MTAMQPLDRDHGPVEGEPTSYRLFLHDKKVVMQLAEFYDRSEAYIVRMLVARQIELLKKI